MTQKIHGSYTQSWLPKGFTLIELLVVVLIIGILAAVAVPQYQKAVLKSRLAQWDVTFNTANKAIDMYLLENGWPGRGSETADLTGRKRVETGIDMPGNCDIEYYPCYTSAGALEVYCVSDFCYMTIDGNYNADGTSGNKAFGDDSPYLAYMRKPDGKRYIESAQGKAGCLWASIHPDIPVASYHITKCKNSFGVTLPNPEYTE